MHGRKACFENRNQSGQARKSPAGAVLLLHRLLWLIEYHPKSNPGLYSAW
jgi:hypothetical protein